jgi:enoyl-CoA hydratase
MLQTERRGRVLVVSVDHPPHNFMTAAMVRELDALIRGIEGDRSIGAVVITGKPEDLYVTHYDVAEILASVRRAGIAAPPWLTSIVLRLAGAVRRACARSPSGRRWPRSSNSTGSTTCSPP